MDAKWKRLPQSGQHQGCRHQGIQQADLYQLYTHGRKYRRDGQRRGRSKSPPWLYLLYPWSHEFPGLLDFEYEDGLWLSIRPTRLDDEKTPVLDQPPDVAILPNAASLHETQAAIADLAPQAC